MVMIILMTRIIRRGKNRQNRSRSKKKRKEKKNTDRLPTTIFESFNPLLITHAQATPHKVAASAKLPENVTRRQDGWRLHGRSLAWAGTAIIFPFCLFCASFSLFLFFSGILCFLFLLLSF